MRIPRFKQSSLHSRRRRIGFYLRGRVLRRFVPSPKVYLLSLGGRLYKRITYRDSWLAWRNARHLERVGIHRIFPALIARFENEMLVEFVEGRTLTRFDIELIGPLAQFFARLYSVDARQLAVSETDFSPVLLTNLEFLLQVGVIDRTVHDRLSAQLEAMTPGRLWVGYDYFDALPKNFVVASCGRVVGIDVGGLVPDTLIGQGVAKAFLHMPVGSRALLLDELGRISSLDLAAYMPFVELFFLASWTKILYLKGRTRLIEPALFDPARYPLS